MICKFDDVTERDMDMLFVEEMVSSTKFLDIFISRIGIDKANVVESELSKTNTEWGESDITIILSVNNEKHALLIEDKIDANAMPNQCERYFERGNVGIANGEYDKFDVFIVAPEKYLSQNSEAAKYPNKVTYEECVEYFLDKEDKRSLFKLQQITKAIDKQKQGYQVVAHAGVTSFWDKYITYQEENYLDLLLVSKRGEKGFKSRWPQFDTVIKGVCIYHKSEAGVVDLTIPRGADKIVILERELKKGTLGLEEKGIIIQKTGKAAVLRKKVKPIDFAQTFEAYEKEVKESFEAVKMLTEVAKEISLDRELAEFLTK